MKSRIVWLLVWLAPVINILTFIYYNWKIVRGEVSPNAVSWAIWAFITILNATSYKVMSSDWQKSVFPIVSSSLCVLTFGLSVYYGRYVPIDTNDLSVLLLGLAASFVWWWWKSAIFAQGVLQAALFLGFVPMVTSLSQNPRLEDTSAWMAWTVAFMMQTILVLLTWRGQMMDLLYPLNCLFCHAVIAGLTIWSPAKLVKLAIGPMIVLGLVLHFLNRKKQVVT